MALETIEQKAYTHLIMSMVGKLLTFIITCMPLTSYLRVILCPGQMTDQERVKRVEAMSWNCLLLSVVCSSIWCSYAFKVQSIEIAIINVFRKSTLLIS
jgi:hypothetical protein